MKLYSDEDFLQLSGIQHFSFCKRQWALIHIEKIWNENVLTTEGKHLHERADDPFFDETRGYRRVVRSMALVCKSFGFQGTADVVEFIRDSNLKENEGVSLMKEMEYGGSFQWNIKGESLKKMNAMKCNSAHKHWHWKR